jgi:hypothetical protein
MVAGSRLDCQMMTHPLFCSHSEELDREHHTHIPEIFSNQIKDEFFNVLHTKTSTYQNIVPLALVVSPHISHCRDS